MLVGEGSVSLVLAWASAARRGKLCYLSHCVSWAYRGQGLLVGEGSVSWAKRGQVLLVGEGSVS